MNALEQENACLKERLYAVHALGLPEVAAALAPHVHLMDLDVYAHRAELRGKLTITERDHRGAQLKLEDAIRESTRYEAIALSLWAKLGHDVTKEPLPTLEA